MSTRPLGMPHDEPGIIAGLRRVAVGGGGVIVADSATLSDANYPVTNDPALGGIVRASRMKTIWIGVERADGSALGAGEVVVVEPLVLDSNAPADGHWKRLIDAADAPIDVSLDNAGFRELPVAGRMVFLRIKSVTGSINTGIVLTGFSGELFAS